eukprot:721900-Rhodomonas_salina.1
MRRGSTPAGYLARDPGVPSKLPPSEERGGVYPSSWNRFFWPDTIVRAARAKKSVGLKLFCAPTNIGIAEASAVQKISTGAAGHTQTG